MEKLHEYQGWQGRFNEWRDGLREKFSTWRDEHPGTMIELVKKKAADAVRSDSDPQDYSHIYRSKTRMELIRVSAAVMGIEFSYAAETAFVSPTLLRIGVKHQNMTLVWALSPLIGFFLTPVLGSISDRCRINLGRRRPFIVLLSLGVFLGLLLVPNGEDLGYAMGDFDPYESDGNRTSSYNKTYVLTHPSTASETEVVNVAGTPHPWGIFFTILGTILLDFDADACQSPARAYLLDVTIPEDHAKGLSTFTVMAGLGGFMGYSLGGINWDATAIGIMLGGHVRAVFTIVTFIFIFCVLTTVTSFREIPLWILDAQSRRKSQQSENNDAEGSPNEVDDMLKSNAMPTSYGTVPNENSQHTTVFDHPEYSNVPGQNIAETSFNKNIDEVSQPHTADVESVASLNHYLMSIIYMPHSLRMVCLTNLFCWMAHVCYSLYFTDFVGEAVFGGDPKAAEGSLEQDLYSRGVRFGCWGMAMYSLSCACYSLIIERLIQRFGAKQVYVGGLLFYSTGMCLMALTKARISVIVFSWAAGVMYSTLFTMPYLLIAHYHSEKTFEIDATGDAKIGTEVRGLGTDVAIVSSMVFLAQFILSMCMGTIVKLSGTTTAVVSVASFLSFCGAIAATRVMYLNL